MAHRRTEVYVDASIRDTPMNIRSEIAASVIEQNDISPSDAMECTRELQICTRTPLPVPGIGIRITGSMNKDFGYTVATSRATISRAEILAVRTALILTFKEPHVVIYTDSQHVVSALHTDLDAYMQRKWINPNGKHYMAESDVSRECVELMRLRKATGKSTAITKVVAHSGNVGNTVADQLAYAAAYGKCDGLILDDVTHSNGVAITTDTTRRSVERFSKHLGVEIYTLDLMCEANDALGGNLKSECIDIDASTITVARDEIEQVEEDSTVEVDEFQLCMFCASCCSVVLIRHYTPKLEKDAKLGVVATYCRTCTNSGTKLKNNDADLASAFRNSKLSVRLLIGSQILDDILAATETKLTLLSEGSCVKYMSSKQVFAALTAKNEILTIDTAERRTTTLRGGFF